jgi:hypothetical protein
MTTVPLPDGVAQCLIQNGWPVPSTDTKVDLPAMTGAPPASFAGSLPLSGMGIPTASGTIPLSALGVPSTATGLNPVPTDGGATSTGGMQCGQVILNKTIYLVFITPTTTTTTTTTTANGPMTAANGPVTINNTPAVAPVTTAAPSPTTPAATGHPRRKRSTVQKQHSTRKHSTHNRIFLFRKSPGDGSRRVTALAAHAGRGS